MKMVFVNSCPYFGGAEKWHLAAALSMKERGHQASMMVRSGGPLAERGRESGLAVLGLPMSFDLDLYSFLRAHLIFRRDKPDLILLNDQRECRVIAPAAALAGVKARVQRKGWPHLKGSWRDRLVYRRAVTHLIAASKEVAEIFQSRSGLAPDRISVVNNGVDLERIRSGNRAAMRRDLGVEEKEILAGSLGRLVSQKGFDLLIEAMAALAGGGFSIKTAIAGEGRLKGELEKKAEKAGVAGLLIMPGRVEDVPSFLAALDLFVFPSRKEGRSNALAEAMTAGLPIVAADIPGNREMIGHESTGLLVRPNDPDELAAGVRRLLTDRELSRRLGEAAARYAERELSWERMMDRVESLLVRIVEGRGA